MQGGEAGLEGAAPRKAASRVHAGHSCSGHAPLLASPRSVPRPLTGTPPVPSPVSRLITQELGEVSRQLDVEQELRQQAEAFARQVGAAASLKKARGDEGGTAPPSKPSSPGQDFAAGS